jgi:hypothetical protein
MPEMSVLGPGQDQLRGQRDELTDFALTHLRALVLNTKDDKIRLGALQEIDKILALGAHGRIAVDRAGGRTQNNFLIQPPAGTAGLPAALAERLTASTAQEPQETEAERQAATLAALEAADDIDDDADLDFDFDTGVVGEDA